MNIKSPTLGGKQFWTDHCWRQAWRIQKNAMTGHWRLLDPNNVRHAWGSRASCQSVLDEHVPQSSFQPKSIVVLLHGLGRSTGSMDGLARFLDSHVDCVVVPFGYASTRATVAQHAYALRQVVASLPADSEISFVGHSLGNIVVRHALGDWQREGSQASLQRVKHVVMLGPPNQGSALARMLSQSRVFGFVAGGSGLELGLEWKHFEEKLAIPACPFGIIAGSTASRKLQNPLLSGDSDFVVALDETKLNGAKDYLLVDSLHTFLMDHPDAQQAVSNFLDHSSFN